MSTECGTTSQPLASPGEGLFEYGRGQWRAKDLFDLLLLDAHVTLDEQALVRSVEIAFRSRNSDLALADRFLYGVGWGQSRGSRRRWQTFARRHEGGAVVPPLDEAIARVRARLLPIFAAIR